MASFPCDDSGSYGVLLRAALRSDPGGKSWETGSCKSSFQSSLGMGCWDKIIIWSIITMLIWIIIIWSDDCSSSYKIVFLSILCFYTNRINLSLLFSTSNDFQCLHYTSIRLYTKYDNSDLYNITEIYVLIFINLYVSIWVIRLCKLVSSHL